MEDGKYNMEIIKSRLIRDAIKSNDFTTFVKLIGNSDAEIAKNANAKIGCKTCSAEPSNNCTHLLSPFLWCVYHARWEMLEFLANIPGVNLNAEFGSRKICTIYYLIAYKKL